MLAKSMLALAGALVLGVSVAQANESSKDAYGESGADIGPLGQCFVPPDCGRDQGRIYSHRTGFNGFAYVPAPRYRHHRQHEQ
jgi:hypothetical protein